MEGLRLERNLQVGVGCEHHSPESITKFILSHVLTNPLLPPEAVRRADGMVVSHLKCSKDKELHKFKVRLTQVEPSGRNRDMCAAEFWGIIY
jgi:hypothetical protein